MGANTIAWVTIGPRMGSFHLAVCLPTKYAVFGAAASNDPYVNAPKLVGTPTTDPRMDETIETCEM